MKASIPLLSGGYFAQLVGRAEANEDGTRIQLVLTPEFVEKYKNTDFLVSTVFSSVQKCVVCVYIMPQPIQQAKEKPVSADNGVYILHDKKAGTFRVAHAQAIDNLDWYWENYQNAIRANGDTTPYMEPWNGGRTFSSAKEALANYMRQTWGQSPIYKTEESAVMAAWEIMKTLDICEYGISVITAPDVEIDWSPKEEPVDG